VFGIPVSDPVEITEFEPPTRYAIRHEGLFSGGGVITLEPGADGRTTIVRWDEVLRPLLLPDLGAILIEPVLRPIFQADLHRFRRLVETGSADD
jgi:Polyketide cyclase / dehydrase and lipid transport